MALILNLETATEICSVAICQDGKILSVVESNEIKSHAAQITVRVTQALQKAGKKLSELQAVAISQGPGSYTGLRVGTATAKGLCYSLEIPLISVDTLEALSAGMLASKKVTGALLCPMIDARRMEVYTALFDKSNVCIQPTHSRVIESEYLSEYLQKQKIFFFGNGSAKCSSVITHANAIFVTDFLNSATFMAQISETKYKSSEFDVLAYFDPFYLKNTYSSSSNS